MAKRINMEIKRLVKSPLEGIKASPIGDDLFHWKASIIGPPDTPYAKGLFKLTIEFPAKFPFKPPTVKFTTKMYHCNVNDKGGICLDILKEEFSPALTISKGEKENAKLFFLSFFYLLQPCF